MAGFEKYSDSAIHRKGGFLRIVLHTQISSSVIVYFLLYADWASAKCVFCVVHSCCVCLSVNFELYAVAGSAQL